MNWKSLIKKVFSVLGYNISKSHHAGHSDRPLPVNASTDSVMTIGGGSILVPGNHPLRNCIVSFPDYMSQLARLTKTFHSVSADLIAIDVGSNIGDSLCLIKSGADVPVVCIEGDPSALKYLKINSRQFANIVIVDSFLSDKIETKWIDVANTGWNCSLLPVSGATGTPIHFSTLSDVVRSLPVRCESVFLKIDVEGYEPMVVKGAVEFLQKTHPVIMLEYNYDALLSAKQDGVGMLTMLHSLGYGSVIIYDNRGVYLTSGTISEKLFISEIIVYAQSPYRNIPYYDLLIFPHDKQYLFESFRSEELAFFLRYMRQLNPLD